MVSGVAYGLFLLAPSFLHHIRLSQIHNALWHEHPERLWQSLGFPDALDEKLFHLGSPNLRAAPHLLGRLVLLFQTDAQLLLAESAKVGAEGALSLLTEIIAVSDKNSMTKADVDQIVATASDIPGALRTALKIGSAAPEVTATVATRITAAV